MPLGRGRGRDAACRAAARLSITSGSELAQEDLASHTLRPCCVRRPFDLNILCPFVGCAAAAAARARSAVSGGRLTARPAEVTRVSWLRPASAASAAWAASASAAARPPGHRWRCPTRRPPEHLHRERSGQVTSEDTTVTSTRCVKNGIMHSVPPNE